MPKFITSITQDELKRELNYDPDTGSFTRLLTKGGVVRGRTAGCYKELGYLVIRVRNRLYRAQRLAWLYMTGDWPDGVIDHIDGNPKNNRFSNLRNVPQAKNMWNTSRRRDNTSGYKGVTKRRGFWVARIACGGKQHHIGCYATAEMAAFAYNKKAAELFGEFARKSA